MGGTVEDLPCSGWSVMEMTAEHQTEMVAFAAIFCSFANIIHNQYNSISKI